MLGDNPEKPKNPLKKAMRRRNTKQVQFTAPTYYDASDIDYSTEEDEDGDGEYSAHEDEDQGSQSQDQNKEVKEDATVDPAKGKIENDANSINESHVSVESRDTDVDQNTMVNGERTSEEVVERSGWWSRYYGFFGSLTLVDEGSNGRSKKGTLRNTDSFFKDDNVETRKINLTPSLLRDDSSGSTIKSMDPKEVRFPHLFVGLAEMRDQVKTRVSLDSLEKGQAPPEKAKEEKRRKEKKGMLSGLFKRKDKKNKGQEEDVEESLLLGESQQFKESTESLVPDEKQATKAVRQQSQRQLPEEAQGARGLAQQPQRQSSKLQKAPPAKQLSTGKPPTRLEYASQRVIPVDPVIAEPRPDRTPSPVAINVHSSPKIQPEERQPIDGRNSPLHSTSDQLSRNGKQSELPENTHHGMLSPDGGLSSPNSKSDQGTPEDTHRGMLSSTRDLELSPSEPKPSESKPAALKTPKQRMPLDESDSSTDTEQFPKPLITKKGQSPPLKMEEPSERLSESPEQVDVPDRLHTQNMPPSVNDGSSHEDLHPSTHSPTSSPELVEAPPPDDRETPASADQSSRNTPMWSDASLRAYLEDGSDIRDLMILVNDTSNVKPAGPDHPIVKNFLEEERRQLQEISNELDSLLMGLIARKSKGANE